MRFDKLILRYCNLQLETNGYILRVVKVRCHQQIGVEWYYHLVDNTLRQGTRLCPEKLAMFFFWILLKYGFHFALLNNNIYSLKWKFLVWYLVFGKQHLLTIKRHS